MWPSGRSRNQSRIGRRGSDARAGRCDEGSRGASRRWALRLDRGGVQRHGTARRSQALPPRSPSSSAPRVRRWRCAAGGWLHDLRPGSPCDRILWHSESADGGARRACVTRDRRRALVELVPALSGARRSAQPFTSASRRRLSDGRGDGSRSPLARARADAFIREARPTEGTRRRPWRRNRPSNADALDSQIDRALVNATRRQGARDTSARETKRAPESNARVGRCRAQASRARRAGANTPPVQTGRRTSTKAAQAHAHE